MEAYAYEIEYFVAESGRIPFKEWLDGLRDVAGRAKIRVRLDRVRLGNLGDNRSVGEGVRLAGVPGEKYRWLTRRPHTRKTSSKR
jgi:putative addiction module killer protein